MTFLIRLGKGFVGDEPTQKPITEKNYPGPVLATGLYICASPRQSLVGGGLLERTLYFVVSHDLASNIRQFVESDYAR